MLYFHEKGSEIIVKITQGLLVLIKGYLMMLSRVHVSSTQWISMVHTQTPAFSKAEGIGHLVSF